MFENRRLIIVANLNDISGTLSFLLAIFGTMLIILRCQVRNMHKKTVSLEYGLSENAQNIYFAKIKEADAQFNGVTNDAYGNYSFNS